MPRLLRIIHFSTWADHLEDAHAFLNRLPQLNVAARVTNPQDPELLKMARLDCDWHGENTRVFAALSHPQLEFLPAKVTGLHGILELAKATRPPNEEWWLVFEGQSPQRLAGAIEKLMPILLRNGIRICWYAFDEASRTMPAFKELAPHLHILIHDELPLDPAGKALLRKGCVTLHRSWVANLLPRSVPLEENPEPKILFLGSKLGLTEHRRVQLEYLKREYGDQFVAIHDHSVAVSDRSSLRRYKVSVCPEGRKFSTPAMGMTHTDRPFWSGCMGLVPVSEDSRNGGRLEALAEQRLIFRYSHGDLKELKEACDRALRATAEDRRRIYNHFNQHETVGAVMASALHTAGTN
jgi:hypothetical protein